MKINSKLILGLFLLLIAFWGVRYFLNYKTSNVKKEGYFHVASNATYAQILDSIRPFIKDMDRFEKVAKSEDLKNRNHAGRYKVVEGKTSQELVQMLKNGNQVDITFRIGDFSDVYQMMGRVARKTQADSLTFIKEFDKIAKSKGLSNAEDLKKYFLIDSYNFFWTVSPQEFFERFEKQYNSFWTPERIAKEKALGLTRNQVYALASIVYQESGGKPDEQKTIAGLYLNRYRKGMKLQSDPTVIYAHRKDTGFQTEIKRVYYKHLRYPSPYNTYANVGIPPGPICIVDKSSIDAVLNPESHGFIFMAADPQRPGLHRFTSSDIEHAKNARDYQQWLDRQTGVN